MNDIIIQEIILELSEDGVFDNPFIHKHKFESILKELLFKINPPIDEDEWESLIYKTIHMCIEQSVTEALNVLIDTDLVETVINADGEIAYRLKQ
jgi:hypothetical protein